VGAVVEGALPDVPAEQGDIGDREESALTSNPQRSAPDAGRGGSDAALPSEAPGSVEPATQEAIAHQLTNLKALAALSTTGVLTPSEVAALKARVLSSGPARVTASAPAVGAVAPPPADPVQHQRCPACGHGKNRRGSNRCVRCRREFAGYELSNSADRVCPPVCTLERARHGRRRSCVAEALVALRSRRGSERSSARVALAAHSETVGGDAIMPVPQPMQGSASEHSDHRSRAAALLMRSHSHDCSFQAIAQAS
jgi:hypothetical protein